MVENGLRWTALCCQAIMDFLTALIPVSVPHLKNPSSVIRPHSGGVKKNLSRCFCESCAWVLYLKNNFFPYAD